MHVSTENIEPRGCKTSSELLMHVQVAKQASMSLYVSDHELREHSL